MPHRGWNAGFSVLLFTGWADIKNDKLKSKSISLETYEISKLRSLQGESRGNLLEQIQFSEPESLKD